jgi:hypothetical protein
LLTESGATRAGRGLSHRHEVADEIRSQAARKIS